jgi:ABC-2 type transport system permease protein
MKQIWCIFKKEVHSYFISPVAPVLMSVFLLLAGFFYYAMTTDFLSSGFGGIPGAPHGPDQCLNINEMLIRPLIMTYGFIAVLLLPMLSMRLFAEERRSGTIRLLLAAPVTSLQVVFGKYFAAVFVYLMLLACTGLYQITYFVYSAPEILPVLAGYLGLFLMGAAFISVGMWISSLTRSQVVAVVITLGVLLLFWLISWAGGAAAPHIKKILDYISLYNHYQDMAKGVLDTTDGVYYLTLIVGGIYFTQRSVESYRLR